MHKDAFDLWWEWADKPLDSPLMIDATIHDAVMALPPDERRDRAKVNEAVREGLRLGPLRPAASAELHGVPKAKEGRMSRNVGFSQNGSDFVGAVDYGDARKRSRSVTFRGGATWACGVFGKMPRRRQGMRQPLYLEISDQRRRVERCYARLH
jgi:hypothetical protein